VTGTVAHKFGAKRGAILGAWAIAHRKGRRPVVKWAEFSEYKKSNNVWNSYPSAMICKVAEVMALKAQFGINGFVSQEEAGEIQAIQDGGRAINPASGEVLSDTGADEHEADTYAAEWDKAHKYFRASLGDARKTLSLTAAAAGECAKAILTSRHGTDSTKDRTPNELRDLADAIKADPKILVPDLAPVIEAELVTDDDIPAFDEEAPFVAGGAS